jgi:copper chaperone CopZ
MKNINLKCIAIACCGLLMSMKSYSQISKAEIVATGLTCSMCSNAINKQLKKLVKVDSVSTDLNTNTFVVYLKKDSTLSPKTFKESVEKAGFFIGSMQVTIPADQLRSNSNYIFIEAKAPTSTNEVVVKIFDKEYVTAKEYKKLLKSYSKIETFALNNEADYHIKIVE